jgi:hypothetical protein
LVKIKNVRPGILIIADAGLKLTPGESRDVEQLTPQTRDAISAGLLAQVDKAQEPKPAGKAADKGQEAKPQAKTGSRKSEEKGPGRSDAAKAETTEPAAGESGDDTGGSGEQSDAAQKSLVEVESGDQ